MKKYDSYVSLGPNCSIAASLEKYGFRSFSSPFDWVFVEGIENVISFIETDFSDFLKIENLKQDEEHFSWFHDYTHKIHFLHDFKNDLEREYDKVSQKYYKRILRTFHENKTLCFVYGLINIKDVSYIKENSDLIHSSLKRNNPENDLIILVPDYKELKEATETEFPFQTFKVGVYDPTTKQTLSGLFDESPDLLDYLSLHFDKHKQILNIGFESEKKYASNNYKKLESRYDLALKLLNCNIEKVCLPKKIAIYGAGNIGKAFFDRIKSLTNVVYFIDNNLRNKSYQNTPILSPKEIPMHEVTDIIITAMYDYDDIVDKIKKQDKTIVVHPITEFL